MWDELCFLLFESIEKEKRIEGDIPTQADVPMVTIQRILRHKNLTTTERYIRGLEPVRPALEVLSNRNSRP
jgi:integrase